MRILFTFIFAIFAFTVSAQRDTLNWEVNDYGTTFVEDSLGNLWITPASGSPSVEELYNALKIDSTTVTFKWVNKHGYTMRLVITPESLTYDIFGIIDSTIFKWWFVGPNSIKEIDPTHLAKLLSF